MNQQHSKRLQGTINLVNSHQSFMAFTNMQLFNEQAVANEQVTVTEKVLKNVENSISMNDYRQLLVWLETLPNDITPRQKQDQSHCQPQNLLKVILKEHLPPSHRGLQELSLEDLFNFFSNENSINTWPYYALSRSILVDICWHTTQTITW